MDGEGQDDAWHTGTARCERADTVRRAPFYMPAETIAMYRADMPGSHLLDLFSDEPIDWTLSQEMADKLEAAMRSVQHGRHEVGTEAGDAGEPGRDGGFVEAVVDALNDGPDE